MIDSNFIKNSKLKIQNVSRETLDELNKYSLSIIKKNREINLISSSTEKSIKTRHIYDSAQSIEFIDKNDINVCTDLGSGAGLPSIVLGILMKSKKPGFKLIFYEKSYHKSIFLKEMTKKFKLEAKIFQKNIFEEKNLVTDVIICRAFKPLPVILDLIDKNFDQYSNLVVFMGKNGKQMLKETINVWQFEYKEIKSLTSNDSFLLNIKNIKRK